MKDFELPHWFNVDTYSKIIEPFQWVIALSGRQRLMHLALVKDSFPEWEEITDGIIVNHRKKVIDRCLEDIKTVANYIPSHPETVYVKGLSGLEDPSLKSPVSSVTIEDAVTPLNLLTGFKCGKAYIKCFVSGTSDNLLELTDLQRFSIPAIPLHLSAGYPFSQAFAKVDLEASDKDLIDSFKAWIAEQRSFDDSTSKARTISPTTLEQWSAQKVLAYIDLRIWALLNDMQLTHHQAGLILFPNEYDVALNDKIRRSVLPLSDYILKEETINAIRYSINKTA